MDGCQLFMRGSKSDQMRCIAMHSEVSAVSVESIFLLAGHHSAPFPQFILRKLEL